jgi:hypothetical protein
MQTDLHESFEDKLIHMLLPTADSHLGLSGIGGWAPTELAPTEPGLRRASASSGRS